MDIIFLYIIARRDLLQREDPLRYGEDVLKKNHILAKISVLLIILSAIIYLLQILIFRDVRNTFFYIFQDFAFLPVSIAVATIAVGALLDERDRLQKIEGTRMLRSVFFTGIGSSILLKLSPCCIYSQEMASLMHVEGSTDTLRERSRLHKAIRQRQEEINAMDLRVKLDRDVYEGVCQILEDNRPELLIMSSNNNLMVEKSFKEVIWGIFHLMDEFHLRGHWEDLSEADIQHLEDDFSTVLRLMLANSIGNTWYLKETYPEFYGTAREKLQDYVSGNEN